MMLAKWWDIFLNDFFLPTCVGALTILLLWSLIISLWAILTHFLAP